jgi:hypothetical protein
MSIKQQGGVFGRNPTFNDVTIEGTLTFDGDIDVNSDLKVDGDLDVTGSALIGTTTANTTYAPRLYTESALGDGNGGILIGSYKPSATFLDFSGGTPAVHRIANDGGNLYFETDTNQDGTFDTVGAHFTSVGNLAFASGKGIDFSATAGTGTSELFDDYEEGDFSVTSPTAEVVLNANTCKYTKVGRKVTCSGAISVASIGAPTGNVDFGGFPFTSANVDGADISVDIYTYGWKTSMTTSVMGAMSRNAAGFFVQKTNGAGSVAVLSGDVQAGTVIWFSVSYIVA